MKAGFNERFTETVAVKTLKGFLQKELVTDLLKECAKMQELDHPNILPLRGVCLDGGPAPYIIMPFMANGSLLGHLRENGESLVLHPTTNLDKVVRARKVASYCNFQNVCHSLDCLHYYPSHHHLKQATNKLANKQTNKQTIKQTSKQTNFNLMLQSHYNYPGIG